MSPDSSGAPREGTLEELMAAYQQANPSAATALVQRLSPALYRFFSAPMGSQLEADDMLQEMWLRIHRLRHTHRPGEPVLPWVYAIARRVRVDHYRKRRRSGSEVPVEQLPELAAPIPVPNSSPTFQELLASLPRKPARSTCHAQAARPELGGCRSGYILLGGRGEAEGPPGVSGSADAASAHRTNSGQPQEGHVMNCREVDQLLTAGDSSHFSVAAREHLQSCGRCRALVRALEAPQSQPVPAPEQINQATQLLIGDLTTVKPLPNPALQSGIFAVIVLAALAAGGAVLGLRGWDALQSSQRLGVFLSIALIGVSLVVSLTRQMSPGSPSALTPAAWAVGLGSAVALLTLWLFQHQLEMDFVHSGLACLETGLAVAALTGLLLAAALRRGAMLSRGFSGSTAGAVAGLTGLAVLEMQCPNLNAAHILAWHLPVVVFSSLAGLVTGLAVGLIPSSSHQPTSSQP